jgi:apolipoprotein N-acyltransferase
MGTAEIIRAKVGLINGQTPSDKAGDWALVGVLAFLFIVAARAYKQRR